MPSQERTDQGALASARGSDNGDVLAAGKVEVDPLQDAAAAGTNRDRAKTNIDAARMNWGRGGILSGRAGDFAWEVAGGR
jgi:hypothetical protein